MKHIEAALALKEWIRRGGSKGNPNEDKEDGPKESGDEDGMPLLQRNGTGENGGDQSQLIDEDEARHIDQLLNSKTSAMDKLGELPLEGYGKGGRENEGSSIEKAISEETGLNTREKRSRKPNRKYNLMEEGNLSAENSRKSKDQKASKSGSQTGGNESRHVTPVKSKSKERTPKINLNPSTSKSHKRKIRPVTDDDPKKPKMAGENSSNKKGRTRRVSTPHNQIEDFVLPLEILKEDQPAPPELANEMDNNNIPEYPTPESQAEFEDNNSQNQKASPNKAPQLTQERLPAHLTGRYREELVFYTPNAKKLREEELRAHSASSSSSGSSRRKQNLAFMDLSEEFSVLGTEKKKANEKPADVKEAVKEPAPPKPKDLTQVPVYLTEMQRDLFFKPLKPLFNTSVVADGLWQCGECGEVLKCIKDGRRHMVSHIRVMRIRCSLCDAGAFFCSDMRVHLMYRHCDKLHIAPDEFISPGVPCMDKEKADLLTCLVDPYHPGRVMYTTGKIVSWSNPKAYLPDPKIEKNILGPALPGYLTCSSPRKQFKSSILASARKPVSTQPKEKPNEEAGGNDKSTKDGEETEPEVVEETANNTPNVEPEEMKTMSETGESAKVMETEEERGMEEKEESNERMEEGGGGGGEKGADHDYGAKTAMVEKEEMEHEEEEGRTEECPAEVAVGPSQTPAPAEDAAPK